MKKIFTLIIVVGLSVAIRAQDIVNTLGPSGNYIIEDDSNNEIIKVDAAGTFHFINEVAGESTQFDLYNAGHNLKLNFYKANGTPSTPTSVGNLSALGLIYFNGYTGSNYQTGASIFARVSGTPSGTTMPTGLVFQTMETNDLTTKMTISPNGNIGIGVEVANSTIEVNGSMSLSYDSGGSITLDETHYTYVTQNGATVTLPNAAGITGRVYIVKLITDGGSATVNTNGENIDGATTYSLSAQWKYVKVQSNGTAWIIIGQN